MTPTTPRQRAVAVAQHAADALGATVPAEPAPEDLDALTRCCVERIERAGPGAQADRLAALVVTLQRLALELRDHELSARTHRLGECERGLGRLRGCTTTAVLLDRVCREAARSCGLERVLLSRVQDGRWYPWVVNAAVAGEPWVDAWSENAITLDDTVLESRLLLEHRPALVTDTTRPEIHDIIRQGASHSYVVAPIAPAGHVLGFFHADHLTGGRACDETDRDVLWRFAEGFGQLYERTSLVERLHAQRTQVRHLLGVVDDAMEDLTAAEVQLATRPDADPTSTALSVVRSMSSDVDQLTARERDVLALVVAGARNREIAERLAIGEGTVKTHVKHLLAKLGATNRSHLVARYLGFRDTWSD